MEWRSIEVVASREEAGAELVLVWGGGLSWMGSAPLRESVDGALRFAGVTSCLAGQSLDILLPESGPARILALGVGAELPREPESWLSVGSSLIEAMARHRLASVRLPGSNVLGGADMLERLLLGALLQGFRRDSRCASAVADACPATLWVYEGDVACAERARALAAAVNQARAWVESPPNVLNPLTWIDDVRRLFASPSVVRVLGAEQLQEIGAGALLAVGRGSEHGARLLIVEWRGDPQREGWDAALVGKGLTFDGGGLNLKTRPNISKMKLDMAGGAAVLGALQLASARRSRANVVAIVPVAENAIDALSFRPGDVIVSLAGVSVEVADTDFEGRLVLADALTYALRNYGPVYIVDAATLTTAVTSVLHEEFAALYASDDELAQLLIRAGEEVGERLWRMPLVEQQDYLVESEIADISNIGAPGYFGFGIGSPTAGAKFLERFVRGTRWAHLDIAGTAWSTGRGSRIGKGATGYGVRLLDRWLAALEACGH